VSTASILILLLASASGSAAERIERPNVVLILADDLGYGDLGCYGSTTIATPRLDRMAAEGLKLTDFYVASPFCSPSRAALLTGRLPARCGVPYVLFPAEHTGLPPEEITIAEVLRNAGYATGCIGKWHLGWRRELRPQQQGFQEYFGLLHTNDIEEWTPGKAFHQLSSFEPLTLREGNDIVEQPVDQSQLTTNYTARAIKFLRTHRAEPFFLFLSHTMPHIPQYASEKFAGRSKDGIYGDAIEELDASVGAVLDELEALDLAKKTLVIFTSDNGAGLRGKGPRPNSRFPGRDFGGSNGPLKAGKGTTWEGGVRVPCLVRWPGRIAAGRVETTLCSAMDFFPTIASLAGAKPSSDRTFDGVDISAMLTEGRPPDERLIPHDFGVQLQAVRRGNWKLIVPIVALPAMRVPSIWFDHQPGLFEKQHRLWPKAALYDVSNDPGETTDVAAAHPEVVSDLLKQARELDEQNQRSFKPVTYLPGPAPPRPGQKRTGNEDLSAWVELQR
jgi:arylsulfatase A-like enzyme